MQQCSKCKTPNDSNETYCIHCGCKLHSKSSILDNFSPIATQYQNPQTVNPQRANKDKTQILSNSSPPTERLVSSHYPKTELLNQPHKPTLKVNSKHTVINSSNHHQGNQNNSIQTMIPNFGDAPLVGFLVCRNIANNTNGVFWPLRVGRTYIGRNPEEAQIVLPYENISGAHAVIIFRNNSKNWISDNNSMNGTFVNGEDIGPDKKELKNNDQIKIGDLLLTVVLCQDQEG